MKQNWEYKKLGDVCDILDSKRKPVTKSNRKSGIYPYYGATGIQDYVDSYIFDGRFLLVGEDGAKWGKGDNSAFIIEGKSWVNNHAHILRIHENMSDVFIRYFLNGADLNSYITGAVVPKLTQAALVSIQIPVPPLSEQSRIVAELDLLTGIIDKQNAQLKELDNLAQAIFYDMFGDPIENPKRWDVKNLGAVCDFKNGLNFAPDETGEKYYLIGVSDFQTKSRLECDETLKTIELSKPLGEEYLLADDDILFVRSNGNKDLIARNVLVTTNGLNVTYSGFCIRARVKNDDVIPFFLNSLLKLPSAHNALTASGHGCNIANLNQKTLDGFQLILPPHSLQQSFAEKIQSIEKQKETIRASIADTQKLLDYTMDKYFG